MSTIRRLFDAAQVPKLTPEQWATRPVLEQGHDANLVFDDGKHRVWVSRMTLEDFDGDSGAYEKERVVHEVNRGGRWVRVTPLAAKRPTTLNAPKKSVPAAFKKRRAALSLVKPADVSEEPDYDPEDKAHAVEVLRLFAENTGELYPQKKQVIATLQKKADAGTYDPARAVDAWRHWVEASAKQFAKEEGVEAARMFTPAVRKALAEELAQDFATVSIRGEGVVLPPGSRKG